MTRENVFSRYSAMALNRIESIDVAKWIRDGTERLLAPDDTNWHGNFVSHCVPPIFEAYSKLFHAIYTDASAVDDPRSWAAADTTIRSIGGVDLGRLQSVPSDYGPKGRRVPWRELAERFGLQFHAEFNDTSLTRVFPDNSWPRSLLGPDEGTLDEVTCQRLVEILKPFTERQSCHFHYDVIATGRCEADVAFSGELDDVIECCNDPEVRGTPTHWWPEHRTWLVCSDWDLKFTLIGGPRRLVNQLIADDELECIAVTPSDRIDFKADRLNSPHGGA
jgi:hypothetical protein